MPTNSGNKNATGQPVKLFKEKELEDFLNALKKGASNSLACKYIGVSYMQYRELMKRAKRYIERGIDEDGNPVDENNPYIATYRKIEQAFGARALVWLDKIEEASDIHWQAAAWKLERCHPEDYAKKELDLEKKTDENTDAIRELKETVQKCMKPIA